MALFSQPGQAAGLWAMRSLAAIVFGLIGYVAFRRGRKTSAPALTWTVGAALCAWLYARWN